MKSFITQKQWGWKSSGIALGVVFLLATLLVKPIGVSTQFVILDGIVWNLATKDLVTPDATAKQGYASSNAYLNKSGGKYAKHIAKPLNYSFIFVLAMIAGGVLARISTTEKETKETLAVPEVWRKRFGGSTGKRYVITFLGGFIALFGARLAGGCTSGHMMSGMMQTSLSGYLFALGAFVVAVPVALLMFKGDR
jgi:hypothetical protein